MNDEQRKAAEAIFGKEFTDQLVTQGQQKTKELEDAGVASKQAADTATRGTQATPEPEKAPEAAPTPEPAPVAADPAQLVQELAVTMQDSLNEAIAPVLSNFQQQITVLGEQFKALSDELKQVRGEQAIKQQVELPRFTFDLIRATQANSTVVPEGDALKDKKPKEASPVAGEGSVAASYFLSAKR